MVGARGFEPPTPCSRSRCATRLRYAPNRCSCECRPVVECATAQPFPGRSRILADSVSLAEKTSDRDAARCGDPGFVGQEAITSGREQRPAQRPAQVPAQVLAGVVGRG